MAADGPEAGDGGADRGVVGGCVLVDVARIGDLALGGGVDAVDLVRGQVFQVGETELFRYCVNPRVLE